MKLALSVFLVFFLAACSGDKSAESSKAASKVEMKGPEIKTKEVSYTYDGLTMNGFMAYDASNTEKRPAVLVVHEWWGHNDYARNRAKMLAEMGYVALAVDMYGDGKQAAHPDDAMKFAMEASQNAEAAQGRFEAAMAELKKNPLVDAGKIAAIGYCFGGGVVLNMARMGVDLDGVVSFHGSLAASKPAEAGMVKARMLVCNGADDTFVTAEQITDFKSEMDAAGVDYKFISYPGAVHSFTNPEADGHAAKFGMNLAYNEAADKASWQEMETFFNTIFAN